MPGPVGANPTPGHDVESTTRQGSGCLGLALFNGLVAKGTKVDLLTVY